MRNGEDSSFASSERSEESEPRPPSSSSSSSSSSSPSSSSGRAEELQLLERLIRTENIWFLPKVTRPGAIHLLQGKNEGNFLVRHSRKPESLALSVRLPPSRGPYIEHYLIEGRFDGPFRLERSTHYFRCLAELITYYCTHCDELPVKLRLPGAIMEASFRQLRSLSLLGQDFWKHYSASSPVPGPLDTGPQQQQPTFSTFKSVDDDATRAVPDPPPRWSRSTLLSCQLDASADSASSREPSQHYLESTLPGCPVPEFPHRSRIHDKASDYEDIWGGSPSLPRRRARNGPFLCGFSSLDNLLTPHLRASWKSVHSPGLRQLSRSHDPVPPPPTCATPAAATANGGDVPALLPFVKNWSCEASWTLDSSWEFVRKREGSDGGGPSSLEEDDCGNVRPVEELIASRYPDLPLPPFDLQFQDYDNLRSGGAGKGGGRRVNPLPSPQLLTLRKHERNALLGARVAQHVGELARDADTTFSNAIRRFVECTRLVPGRGPFQVMRNARQFLSGMKNYLTLHGEGRFRQFVDEERQKLQAGEFLNLSSILEEALYPLVLAPLHSCFYKLLLDHVGDSGELQRLRNGMQPDFVFPCKAAAYLVLHALRAMQRHVSPIHKLNRLMSAVSAIFTCLRFCTDPALSLGAEDFLPLFEHLLSQVGMLGLEVEAEYMWALLPGSMKEGESGYYLSMLFGAVQALKSLADSPSACPSTLDGFVRVYIADEAHGAIVARTFPLGPHSLCRDLARLVAHKQRITNPQDYALFLVCGDQETQLADGDRPKEMAAARTGGGGTSCAFVYKRQDAKIAWPKLMPS